MFANTRATPDTEEGKQTRLTNAQKIGESGPRFLIDAMAPEMSAQPPAQRSRSPCEGSCCASAHPASCRRCAAWPPGPIELRYSVLRLSHPDNTGAEDNLIPPTDSETMHALIPNSTLVNIPTAGHLSNIDKADDFNQAMREFHRIT